MRPRSALSSHLTISYASTPAAGVPAAATGSNAPAPDNPLGFLAALVDQLLSGGAEATAAPTAALDTPIDPAIPGLFSLNATTEPATGPAPEASPDATALLAQLTDALAALTDETRSGAPADPQKLKDLGDAIDALAGLLGIQIPPPQAPTDPAPDPLAALAPADPAPALPGATAPAVPSIAEPPPLPALAALAGRLTDLGATLKAEAPDLSQKLGALAATLNAAQADPDLLAKLAGASDPGGVALDAIVRSLLDSKAAIPAPQLAASLTLDLPKALAPQPPLAALQPAELAADPAVAALKLTVAAKATDTADDAQPRLEAKVAAALAAGPAADQPEPAAATTNTGATPPISVTAPHPRVAQAAYQPLAAQAATLPQFAFEMARQFNQGQSRFTIRLDPPELGKVDVKMHVDAAGNVNARLTVERAETLDMFQRDHRTLERALAQAGLDSSKTSLEFALKQNPFGGTSGGNQHGGSPFEGQVARASGAAGDEPAAPPAITLYRGAASARGVNLFV